MRKVIAAMLVALALCSCAAAKDAPAKKGAALSAKPLAKPAVYNAPGGASYVVRPAGATDAIASGGGLLVDFCCYNRGRDAVDGPTIFAASKILLLTPKGTLLEPKTQPLGIWDGPSVIAAGSSFTSTVDVGALFADLDPGEYVVEWEVANGIASLPIRVFAAREYYLYRLQNDTTYNDWALHVYGADGVMGGGLGMEAVAVGPPLVPGLARLANDKREAMIEGSEDATIGAMYQWRVCDFAGIILTTIWGQPPGALRSQEPAERDKRLAELQAYYRLHEQEFKE